MHRYQCRQTPPLPQLTIDVWKTTTPNKFHIWKNAHIPVQTDPPPPPINHRSMEDHYTSAERPHPLLQLTIDLWQTATLNKFHREKNAQIPVQTDPTLPPINHRSMEDHYTSADRPHPLLQLTIDLWETTTPVQTDPMPSSN